MKSILRPWNTVYVRDVKRTPHGLEATLVTFEPPRNSFEHICFKGYWHRLNSEIYRYGGKIRSAVCREPTLSERIEYKKKFNIPLSQSYNVCELKVEMPSSQALRYALSWPISRLWEAVSEAEETSGQ